MANDATTAPQYDPGALPGLPSGYRPWPALWALVVGFFMILVDSTIVSVATDSIWIDLTQGKDLNGVIWVTSGYLLAYVVPLLLAGRLGDMFGPKRLYLVGLTIFTLSSAWLTAENAASMTARETGLMFMFNHLFKELLFFCGVRVFRFLFWL